MASAKTNGAWNASHIRGPSSGTGTNAVTSDQKRNHPGQPSSTDPTASQPLSVVTQEGTVNEPTDGTHPLRNVWVFWFMHREPGAKVQDYNNAIKKLATFGTVEEFWGVYSRLKRPMDLHNINDYHLFKQGVRPIWEDNLTGGKWIVRLKKGLASRYWESLVMAMIGDQFDVGAEICGAVISIRHTEDILSLWNITADDGRVNLRIRDTLKRVLNLPPNCIMEYKAHKSSVADNSSFRNTEMFR